MFDNLWTRDNPVFPSTFEMLFRCRGYFAAFLLAGLHVGLCMFTREGVFEASALGPRCHVANIKFRRGAVISTICPVLLLYLFCLLG